MIKKLIVVGLSVALIVVAYLLLSSQTHTQTLDPVAQAESWPPFVAQYREEGELSFIWDMEPGSQTFELDYTDTEHWTRTILSSTVEGAAKATAILDGNIVMLSRPAINDTYTMTVDANFAPNEWLSYIYLSNLQKKPTVVLREGPTPEETTAIETFERPCYPSATTKEEMKECENSVVIREFTYRTTDYILTKLVGKVDGSVFTEVTLEKLTFKE